MYKFVVNLLQKCKTNEAKLTGTFEDVNSLIKLSTKFGIGHSCVISKNYKEQLNITTPVIL
ncbi:MAG: hypothetical protein UR39_C0010G0021 [Candidatus Woesebacteria bacterium GW2011_GWA1_33_30]|uniref:Uncharacterized protein n=1 Tax=Candidatus Woesebacteria bacterium GW2011_GWA2_33_28 TaxID=1618561 RepID=A0A0G0C5J7_9BACT|nr:MAG: hypothetical protein UR38_C0010G0021 [Candidatus Woesebacteria bacterium GW2011_GWA2_33_28]KKP47279.1 MAG: hypothetical protein UR39_C0010G0021 [Candidatus Woesebacteria bacterium GW2011_GWA1_33_30]KKP48925.1 MAG: hypothetical protein UR40_C0011G0021 [Microgenomates group bacterium GW2011_GWC1_33_32]KKP51463.1 MAG: hypothetical protein UR44_C0010G0021 [Candidatus Woesebacteria bacterium GW2011_GWB1_33_38]KKP56861.1 MAG: hypothetical protein UR48_C0027G0005 [Microgenomates group bacteriu